MVVLMALLCFGLAPCVCGVCVSECQHRWQVCVCVCAVGATDGKHRNDASENVPVFCCECLSLVQRYIPGTRM